MRLLPVAAAVALLLSLPDAYALALGRATVQSALGEPLRAEVEVTQITAEEVASLRAAPAAPEAFRAAGIDRHPALAELRVSAERLADGRFVLRLASDRVVNEPVIDLLLEASWSAGRIVRDYTLLFDPAAGRASAPAPLAPVTAAQLPPLPAAAPLAPPPEGAAGSATATAAAAAPPATPVTPTSRVTVRPGDTAGRLAAAAKPATVSLEQMLVALLRANPEAFVGNNMNRLRSGAVLEMPAGETAAAIEASEARRTVIAQSQDFNAFRRQLAERTASTPPAAAAAPGAGRQASGQVDARVEDKRPAEAQPDRLTLSKGAVQGTASAPARASTQEDRIARQRADQDANTRQSELERNIAELNRLSAAAGAGAAPAASGSRPASGAGLALGVPAGASAASAAAASASSAATAASAASTAVAAAALASGAASGPASPASAPEGSAAALGASAPASAAAAAAEAVASAAAPASAAALAARAAGPTWGQRLSVLGEPPWPLALGSAAGAGLAAVAGLLWWSRRARRPAVSIDESRLTDDDLGDTEDLPDDARGGLGMARGGVDMPPPAGRSSLLYSPSQLDTSGDPDPVAEAEVYLAYGRDLQAEEILQEALRVTPERMAVIAKLLEVLARRFDWEAFEPLARRAQSLTGGRGPEWERVAELGRSLAPAGHPLFAGGGALQPLERPAWADATPAAEPAMAAAPPAPAVAATAAVPQGLDLDLAGFRMPAPAAAPADAATPADDFDFNFDPEIDGLPETRAQRPPSASAPAGAPLEFDLAGLNLDLGESTPIHGASGAASAAAADPLATKLSLAEEFLSIGDQDGARSLAQEVRAEATGELRQRAERLLAELG